MLYFTIWVTLLFKPNNFSIFSLLYLSLYWFFFPFQCSYFLNSHIFLTIVFSNGSYSFNINSIISSLISLKSNPIIVSLKKKKKEKKGRSLLCHLEIAQIQFEVGSSSSLGMEVDVGRRVKSIQYLNLWKIEIIFSMKFQVNQIQ